jgi:molecular chaperone DnaK
MGEDEHGARHEAGDLSMRSNIAAREDDSLVPGEVLYRFNPFYFRVDQNPSRVQVEERLYYEPCSICRRASNDPLCNCASLLNEQRPPTSRPSA